MQVFDRIVFAELVGARDEISIKTASFLSLSDLTINFILVSLELYLVKRCVFFPDLHQFLLLFLFIDIFAYFCSIFHALVKSIRSDNPWIIVADCGDTSVLNRGWRCLATMVFLYLHLKIIFPISHNIVSIISVWTIFNKACPNAFCTSNKELLRIILD